MTDMVSTSSTDEGTTDEQTAVRYEQDADGIVTLTLDDPTASANTMTELYRNSMAAAVDACTTRWTDVRAGWSWRAPRRRSSPAATWA